MGDAVPMDNPDMSEMYKALSAIGKYATHLTLDVLTDIVKCLLSEDVSEEPWPDRCTDVEKLAFVQFRNLVDGWVTAKSRPMPSKTKALSELAKRLVAKAEGKDRY